MADTSKRGAAAGARQNFHLQFVTVPTADTRGTGMVLNFDHESYFFGQLGEGFQRACIQRGVGLRKMGKLFLTGTTQWKTYGGLIGLILSLADIQLRIETDNPEATVRERLHIHTAPKGLHVFACARRFVFRTSIPLTVHENKGLDFTWQDEPTYSDENIRVWSVPLRDGSPTQTREAERSSSQQEKNGPTADGSPDSADVEREQALRRKIVSDMFESDWRRDRLFERLFQEVKLPATVWLRDPETKELNGYHCMSHDSAPQIAPDQLVLVRDPWPASLVGELPDASNLPSNISMSYIVKGYPQRGKFDPKKAKSLGVKPGPAFSELIEGGSITLEDGIVITSDMVLEPIREGKGFAFFDLPSRSHLSSLQRVLQVAPPTMFEGISAIVWILGRGVSSVDDFESLLKAMPNFKHVVSDVDLSPNNVALESVALSTLLPAKVAPSHFPVLNFDNAAPYHGKMSDNLAEYGSPLADASGQSMAKSGVRLSVQRTYAADTSEIPQRFDVEHIEDKELAQTLELLQQNEKQLATVDAELTEPEIITVGTGSALPSKYRNVSATLLRMPGDQGNYLFDCGENTLGQLQRIYSATELRSILQNLRMIWISHLHADHHLGTISVLLERAKAFEGLDTEADRTIYLVSEPNMLDFIREYSSVEPSLMTDSGLVPVVSSEYHGTTLNDEPFSFVNTPSAVSTLQSVRVSHCAGAQAVSITFKNGFKISYSGDCRPSWKFCRIGMDSDVLIHEATFDNDMEGDAIAKRHSTTAEALGVGVNMRAKNVVLTHFSQRYHKIPNFENVKVVDEMRFEEGGAADQEEGPVHDGVLPSTSALEIASTVPQSSMANGDDSVSNPQQPQRAAVQMHIAVAFDYMRFKVSEIAGLKDIYPKIQALFDEQDAKAEKEKEKRGRIAEELAEKKRLKHGSKKKDWQRGQKEKGQKQAIENGSIAAGVNGEQLQSQSRDRDGAESTQKQIQDDMKGDSQALSKSAVKRMRKQEAVERAKKRRSLEVPADVTQQEEVVQKVSNG